jgi:hypothetical protein
MIPTNACWYHYCIYLHYKLQHQRWMTSGATALMPMVCMYKTGLLVSICHSWIMLLIYCEQEGSVGNNMQGNCVLFVAKDTLMDCIPVEGRTTELQDKMLRWFWIPPDTTTLRRELCNYTHRDIHWTSKRISYRDRVLCKYFSCKWARIFVD